MFSVGAKVEDAWYWHWGLGVVRRVTKRGVHVWFVHAGLVKYDTQHARQFLRAANSGRVV